MKIAVLGTGMVGQQIGTRLIEKGHHVRLGSRTSDNESAKKWAEENGTLASHGDFKNAVEFAEELVFNCTKGEHVLTVLEHAGTDTLSGKTLVDISNPLDFSNGMPPTLSIVNDNSLGEVIQATYPATKVVKSLNTMSNRIMLNPSLVKGEHSVFISGNDDGAKQLVQTVLESFGWKNQNIIDLGDITSARGSEMLLPIWLRIYGALGTDEFNFHIQTNQ